MSSSKTSTSWKRFPRNKSSQERSQLAGAYIHNTYYLGKLSSLQRARHYIEEHVTEDEELERLFPSNEEARIQEVETLLVRMHGRIRQLQVDQERRRITSPSPSETRGSSHQEHYSRVKLPQIKLARFSGNYADFNSF
ncbi:hypothetical protein M8J77_006007 [Diaphorina citri]|nr:hypothetical protein M8J77_006007 [Diaphorina citri]